MVIVSK